jgi:hypothetical protein
LIPVLLMFVYPGSPADAGPARRTEQRASDADRDIAADILCAAVGDGRLTLNELDERLEAALSARTIRELAALIADLPGRRCAPPPARPSAPAGRLGFGFRAPSRWSVIQALANARTALTSATTWRVPAFWAPSRRGYGGRRPPCAGGAGGSPPR